MKILLAIIGLLLSGNIIAQTVYTMSGGTNGQTVTTCNAIVTDEGGNTADYLSNSNYTMTFCSDDGGPIRIKIEWINLEFGFDFLEIHDGPTTASPSLANLTGFCLESNACPTLNYTSTGSCITLHFTSDGSFNSEDIFYWGGFMAYINCDPDGCNGNDPAADDCVNATPICSLDGYCGTTSQWYTIDAQYTDTYTNPIGFEEFCGSIENNSWLQFTPDATSVTIEVDIFNCFYGDGIQFVLFEGTCAALTQVGTNCWSPIIGLNTLTFTGLTPGNTYYLMIDGFAGDICDYTVTPITGVQTVEVLDALGNIGVEGICPGECTTLSVSSDTPPTSYNWYSVPAGVSGTNSTVNVCPTQDMTVYVDLGGVCGASTTAQFDITMTPVVYTGLPVTTNCEDVSYDLLADPEVTPCVYVVLTSNGGAGELTLLEDGASFWGTNTLDPTAGTIHTFTYYQVSPSAAHSIEFYGNTTSAITYEVFDCANNALLYSGTWNDCGFFPCTQTDAIIPPNVVTGLATWSSTCGGLITSDWGYAVYDPTTATGPFPQSCDITYNWDNESGCSGFDTQNVTITNPYTATFNYSAPSYCQDGADPTPVVTGTSGGTFSAGAGLSINPTSGAIDVSASTPGNYTVTYSVGTLPCGATLDVPVGIVAPPNAGTDGALTVCISGSTTNLFDLLGGTPQATGSWSGPSSLTNGNLGTFDPSTMLSGLYTYTVTAASPCLDASATVNVVVDPLPTATISGGDTYCANETVTDITVAVTGSANWTIDYTFNGTPLTANGSSSPISLGNAEGTYVLTSVSDANCSNTASGTQTIIVNPLPIVTATNGGPYCDGDPMSVSETGGEATGWSWTSDGSATITNATDNTPSITGAVNGEIFTVVGTDANGCQNTAQTTITIDPLPTVTATNGGPYCVGQAMSVSETGGDATGWSWTSDGSATITNATDNTPTITGAIDGEIFTVVGTTPAGCQSSAQTTITINPLPTVTAVNGGPYCVGDPMSVSETGGQATGWLWTSDGSATITNATDNTPTITGAVDGETFTVVGTDANGCQNTAQTTITINVPTTGTDVQTACVSYTWIDGNTYTASTNTPTWTLTNEAGCDSVVTLDLTIDAFAAGTDVQTACDSYTWIDGNTYTADNNTATYTYVGGSVNGCDSIVTLDLTMGFSNTGTDVQTACDSYTWIDGNTYTANNNTATWTLTNASGCDSVVTLDLTITNSNTGTDVQTACDTYIWIDGNTYTASNNTATWTLTNIAGCDSVVTLDLTINNSNTGTDVITACNNYTWIDGNTYTASNNTATWTLTNAAGCDSVVTLDLTIDVFTTGTDVQTACDSYTWIDGNTYTASNNTATYTYVGGSVNGCDSIVTLDLTITTSNTGTDVQSACDSYTWIDGNTYTASNNTATWTLTNVAGCDSVVTLDLTITNSNTGTDVQAACDSYTWIDGNTYTASNNTATWTLTNVAGCDSVVTLDLTINNSNTGTDVVVACNNYTWIDGNNYTASTNTPTWTLTNAAGCDSVVTLDLTISNVVNGTDVQSACGSYTWIDGNTYTTDNNTATYTYIGGSVNGCDSIVTLDLTINNPTQGTDVQSACESYTWIDGNTYSATTNTPTYTYPGGAINGCDSTVTLDLTIIGIPPAPNAGTDSTYCMNTDMVSMSASGTGGTLDWYLDTLSSAIGSGSTYMPDNNGFGATNYYVMETVGNCQGPASMVTINIINCDITIPTAITPNGDLNNDEWEIVDLDISYPDNIVRVYNRWGNLIFEHMSNNGASPYNDNKWDGTYNGNTLPVGSYYYVIQLNEDEVATGAVSIVLD